jgi:hypothetical protein
MAKNMGRIITSNSRYVVTAAAIFLLLLPTIALASTPPVQPSLILKISPSDGHSNLPLTISVVWNRFGIPFQLPPESIIIDAYSLPNGKLVATFPVPRVENACSTDETCTYQKTISATDLPAGDLMLVATDPLSAAFDRQMITVTGQGAGSPAFREGIAKEQVFLGISCGLMFLLCSILVCLIRRRT